MMKHLYLFCLVNCALFIALSGCGGDSSRPKDLPKLYPCTIMMTQEGKPLESAVIDLVPADGTQMKYQTSTVTNEAGAAVFSTYGFDGVPAGKYKVAVTKNIESDVKYGRNEDGEQVVLGGTAYRFVEPQYSNPATTPLEIEITGKGAKTKTTLDAGKAIKIKL